METGLFTIPDTISIIDAMQQINNNGKGIAFLCRDKVLKGCVTDGDIRRYILAKGNLSSCITDIANDSPICLEESRKQMAGQIMREHYLTAVPIVNVRHELVDVCFWRPEYEEKEKSRPQLNIPLVIMAGGKGTRLKPYTDILPKPLIPVGEKTITEYIIEHFNQYGCQDVTMIVNYKKDFIKAYFNDSEIGGHIQFIEEQEYLGTGGGLKLLENRMAGTFFMSNCDIIVNADYGEILHYHRTAGNLITLVCARRKFQIPYGTIEIAVSGQVTRLCEKPEFEYNVNTGFYLIEPSFLEKIPENTFVHITDVIERCVKEGEKVGTFLIDDESWMDMGQLDELDSMKKKLGV